MNARGRTATTFLSTGVPWNTPRDFVVRIGVGLLLRFSHAGLQLEVAKCIGTAASSKKNDSAAATFMLCSLHLVYIDQ